MMVWTLFTTESEQLCKQTIAEIPNGTTIDKEGVDQDISEYFM